jgi:hypothetical protein
MTAAGGLSDQQVLTIARGLLEELARLHDAGSVSGAVGPSTVLVDDEGGVHLVQGPIDQAYASPEVIMGQPPTARSDLYSAAALLAHLFRGGPTLPPTVADLDPGVAWLLGPVLTPDPASRPGSAGDMVMAIEQLAEQRHGREWRAAAGFAGVAGVAGAVPVAVIATGGTAAAAGGVAAAGGAAGVAGAAGVVAAPGVAGAAGAAGGAGATAAGGAVGGVAGGAAGGAAPLAAAGTGGHAAAAGGVVAPQGGVLGGVAAPGAGAPAAAGGASAHGAAGAGQGVAHTGGVHAAGHTSHAVGGGISKGVALKVGAVVAAGGIGVAGAAAAVVLLTGGETEQVELPATADIYLSGVPDDSQAPISDPGTEPVSIDVDGAGTVSFPSVDGDVSACDGCELESPDGGQASFAATAISAFNGIAGVVHTDRTLFVVGVFVGEDQPSQPADAVVDLTDADEEAKQEPELGEPFFVGDGETSDGEQQEIVVPDGATTLYLGFADAFAFSGPPGAYGDNQGEVSIEVTID